MMEEIDISVARMTKGGKKKLKWPESKIKEVTSLHVTSQK